MIHHSEKSWDERVDPAGRSREILFSQADMFRIAQGSRRNLRIRTVRLPRTDVTLLKVRSSGHEICVTDQSGVTVMLPERGWTEVRFERDETAVAPGSAHVLGATTRQTVVRRPATGDYHAYLVKLPWTSRLMPELSVPADAGPVLPFAQSAVTGLTGLMRYVFEDLESAKPIGAGQRGADLLEALVTEHVRALLAPVATGDGSGVDEAVVRRAEEFIAACFSEALTLSDIAAAAGVTPRRLQQAFRAARGTTPWTRLTTFRLERARTLLRAGACASVTEVALDSGFSHLGRFSQAYRGIFGELPSDTLSRSRSLQ